MVMVMTMVMVMIIAMVMVMVMIMIMVKVMVSISTSTCLFGPQARPTGRFKKRALPFCSATKTSYTPVPTLGLREE